MRALSRNPSIRHRQMLQRIQWLKDLGVSHLPADLLGRMLQQQDRAENQGSSARTEALAAIRADLGPCTRCRLHERRINLVFGDGNPEARVIFVGEAPGRDEDLQGLPFVGRAGGLLSKIIHAMGFKRSEVYIANVVKCRPPENRTPSDDEISCCSPFLKRQISAISPQVVVALGRVAAQAVLGRGDSIQSLRGRFYDALDCKVMVTYHPAYLLRNPDAKREVWDDMKQVMAVLSAASR